MQEIRTKFARGSPWHDLDSEFLELEGDSPGIEFIEGGSPLATPRTRVTAKTPTPALETALGVTMGGLIARLVRACGELQNILARWKWTAWDGSGLRRANEVYVIPLSPAGKRL